MLEFASFVVVVMVLDAASIGSVHKVYQTLKTCSNLLSVTLCLLTSQRKTCFRSLFFFF